MEDGFLVKFRLLEVFLRNRCSTVRRLCRLWSYYLLRRRLRLQLNFRISCLLPVVLISCNIVSLTVQHFSFRYSFESWTILQVPPPFRVTTSRLISSTTCTTGATSISTSGLLLLLQSPFRGDLGRYGRLERSRTSVCDPGRPGQ